MPQPGKPLDRILIVDLMLRGRIGVSEDERRERQDIVINIVLHADLGQACRSDRLEDTVDYKAIKKKIIAFVENTTVQLVERLAEGIAEICLSDARVQRADVSVAKPGALRFARSVGVEITRERQS